MLRITNKEEVTRVLFVLSAVITDKKDTREQMKLVYVGEDGEMCCTDGHRAHMVQTDYPAGLYEVIKSGAKEIVLSRTDNELDYFPDYKRCIPSIEGLTPAAKHYQVDPAWKTYTRFNRASQNEGETLDYSYFCDAIKQTEEIYITAGKYAPVVFIGNGARALVMPCRL